MRNKLILGLFLFWCVGQASAQVDSLATDTAFSMTKSSLKNTSQYNALAPAKAAFLSAVVPGLGQAYTGKYWKIPIIYAALGTSVYFYIDRNQEYQRYRDAYKRRLAGYTDDEFQGLLNNETLIDAQKYFQRQKEIFLLVTVGIYVLNIIDANVSAHLQQFNVSKDLTFKPAIEQNRITGEQNYGLSLNFKF